jgi:hypothetical protein
MVLSIACPFMRYRTKRRRAGFCSDCGGAHPPHPAGALDVPARIDDSDIMESLRVARHGRSGPQG